MIGQEYFIKTLAFLDIFDYPPTALEIWRFLGVKAEFKDVVDDSKKESAIWLINKNGFYFLPGREAVVDKRAEFSRLAESKRKVAQRAAKILRFVPGVRMVAVCNNFYYTDESDVDLFIVTEQGKMWTVRFWSTILLDFFHLRAKGKKTADRVCLSFYASDDSLNLESIALPDGDPYLYYWLAFLDPVFDDGVSYIFWSNNEWIKKYMPNFWPTKTNKEKLVQDSKLSVFFRRLGVLVFGGWLEVLAKKVQFPKVSKRFSGPGVVINDSMLKFHENDRRVEFRERLKEKIDAQKI